MPYAALISAAGTLGSLALKNYMDKQRYERELQDQQTAWQRNNVYNSPAAQMARLKAAGLSPNLIYQNGGATPTSDTQGVPSYADAPMADFNPASQMLQQSPTLAANIRKTEAETATIESENRDRFSPLSKLYNFDEQEREFFARAYGFKSVDEVDNLSMHRLSILSELKHKTRDSQNLKEVYKILNNNVGSAENEAYTAAFVRMLTEMEVATEAKKRGYSVKDKYGDGFYGWDYMWSHPSSALYLLKNDDLDYVAQMFLRQYKEINWRSSDAFHILEQFHQTMRDIPFSSLRRGKPTIRGVERQGYDDKRGSYYYVDKYDYYK